MGYLFLMLGIVTEVIGTLSLRVAAGGQRGWYGLTAAGYIASFVLISLALSTGLGIGLTYGIWVAVGVVMAAIGARVLFAEPFTPLMAAGVALICAGVLFIELSTTQ